MKKVAGEWKTKQANISYVYARYPNDPTKYDVTSTYTNVTKIIINVTDSKCLPQSNVKINVMSHNRKNWVRDIGIDNTTNESGQCTFTIGGGNYQINALKKGNLFPTSTKIIEIDENKQINYVNITLEGDTFIDSLSKNPIYFVPIFLIVVLIVFLVIFLRRKFPRKH